MVMHVELQATCSALGYLEGKHYVKEPDCLETVKDLIRFLKREDDSCDIRRELGHAQILQKDLIPIVKTFHTDRALFETVIRLLVNLTQPAIMCFGNKLPEDKLLRNYYLDLEASLQGYKEAFADEDFFVILTEKVSAILKLDWEHRQEEDRMLLERLLVLIRNVLHVPPNPDLEQRTDDDASVHDQLLWVMHISGLEDMLLYIASSEEERHLCMHILEIISLMFREQTPEMLARAGVSRSLTEKEKDERELMMIREKERAQKKANLHRYSTRHSRFGGTYVVTNMQSISDRNLIYHKAPGEVENFSLDQNKNRRKKPRNRAPIKDEPLVRRSTLSIRLSLKEFCVQFLENAYNPLMFAVKDNLVREKTQEHDETYYMWAMRFFMEFCRLHSKRVELVSETMSVTTFHFIYNNLVTYYEMMAMEKKEAATWGKRTHLALKAYQELLMTLDCMDHSSSSQVRDSARVIKCNVFYMMEFRDIFFTLLRKFDQAKQSRAYLKDLAETVHLFLKMLEHFTKNEGHLVVQKKGKKKKKKTARQGGRPADPAQPTAEQLEDIWDEVGGDLSAVFQGRGEIPTDITPFDAASEVDVDQQRVDTMIRIQDELRQKRAGHAVALFRAAREVWPDRDEFGSQNITPEDEFIALREIFMANLPRPEVATQEPAEEEVHEEEMGEEEEEVVLEAAEQEFDFRKYLMNFCHPDILKCYVLLLNDFERNSDHTNHCAVRMLYRMGVELSYIAMLYHASLFRIFQRLMLGPYARLPRFKEMMKIACHVVRKFTEVAERNKKVFVEMLFWKTSKDAFEIQEGYGMSEASRKSGKVLWTEDQEMEVMRLYEDFRDENHPEKDVVDLILERMTDRSKTRNHVIRELKHLGLIGSARELKKKPGSTRPGQWREEEEMELQELHEKFKDSDDPLGNILEGLTTKRSKAKVVEKLLTMGLVMDKKELHKKRRSKSGGRRRRRRGSGSGSDDGDDDLQELGEDFEEPFSDAGSAGSNDDANSDVEDNEGNEPSMAAIPADAADISSLLQTVVENGFQEQLQWIQKCAKRVADDREEDGDMTRVPLVPLSEESENAMKDPVFTRFLQIIGISPPADEQEAFWRIPEDLSVEELRNVAEGLTFSGDGELTSVDKIKPKVRSQAPKPKERKSSKKPKDGKAARKADRDRQKQPKARKESNERKARESKTSKKTSRNKSRVDDSDSEEELNSSQVHASSDESDLEEEQWPALGSERPEDSSKDDGEKKNGKKDGEKKDGRKKKKEDEENAGVNRKKAFEDLIKKRLTNRRAARSARKMPPPPAPDDIVTAEASDSDDDARSVIIPLPFNIQTPGDSEYPEPALSGDENSVTPRSSGSGLASRKRRVQRMVDSDEEDSVTNSRTEALDEPDSVEDPPPSTSQSAKRPKLFDSDSDDDNHNESQGADTSQGGDDSFGLSGTAGVGASQADSQSNKRLRLLDSDSEDDASTKVGAHSQSSSQPTKRQRLFDSDSEDEDAPLSSIGQTGSVPASLLSRLQDSDADSDADDRVPLSRKSQKRKILSDDDDE